MENENHITFEALLGVNDPLPFEILNREGEAPLLLICDHAGNQVPEKLKHLGLSPKELELHIGYDIGVKRVTEIISNRLHAPAVLCNYSRLVIDCNRQPGDPSSISEISDGIHIPANLNLTENEQVQRTEAIFWPYHHAITEVGAHLWRKGTPPALFSIHSFTPQLMSRIEERPWHVAVLWKRDNRLAAPMIKALRQQDGLNVGDNVPYSGWEEAYSIDLHGAAPGLPYCAIEIRQDLISNEAGVKKWGKIIGDILNDILAENTIFEVKHY
jgi:predicted N-formylglutamate amidohydrolase